MSKVKTLNPSTLLARPWGVPPGFLKGWNQPSTAQNGPEWLETSPKRSKTAQKGSKPSRKRPRTAPNQVKTVQTGPAQLLCSQHLLYAPNCGASIPPDREGVAPRPAADLLLGLAVKPIWAVADRGRETYGVLQFGTGPRQVRAPKRL